MIAPMWLTGLILAGAIVPPLVALYILRLRRKPSPISSTMLWTRSTEDLHANTPFQRLRPSLLLLLQLIAVLLLAFSIMQPQLRSGSQTGGKTVLLVDASGSMQAIDVDEESPGMNRFELARERARERIDAMYAGGLFADSPGETMIIGFSDQAEVYARFTDSKQELLNAIDRIRPSHGTSQVGDAVELAKAYTTNPVDAFGEARPIGELPSLELFSDGNLEDIADQVLRGENASERFRYHRVGTSDPDNVSVAAVSVERPYDRRSAVQVFAALLNWNDAEVSCDVQLSVDDTVRAVQEVTLPPAKIDEGTGVLLPGRNNVVFTPFEQPRQAVIEVANLRPDDLAIDNRAARIVPPPRRLKVALVEPKSFIIRTALEGMPLEPIEVLSKEQLEDMASNESLAAYDVIVLDNVDLPPGSLPPAHYLAFGAPPPIPGLNPYGGGEGQFIVTSDAEHPVMRYVNTESLFIAEYHAMQPDDDVTALAEGTATPLVLAVSRGPMQLIYVAFDPLDTNWPFQRSFVTFIYNAVEHLGRIGEGIVERSIAPGEALSTRLPPSATNLALTTPSGGNPPLSIADPTMFSWGPVRETGLYLLEWDEAGTEQRQARAFAVNMPAEREGDLHSPETVTVGAESFEGGTGGEAAYTPLWPYAITFTLFVLLLEWWLYHRRAYM